MVEAGGWYFIWSKTSFRHMHSFLCFVYVLCKLILSALYLDIDSNWRLRTKLYDKRDDFHFPIVNFPFICSNFPAAAYGVYISQLTRYSKACVPMVPMKISLIEGSC